MTSPTICSDAYRPLKMLRRVWLQVCDKHITPVSRQLHWLPVRQRVDFKLDVLLVEELHETAPHYLSDVCQLVANTDRRQLRSSAVNTCSNIRTSLCIGDRSFAVAGPRLWNSLPVHLRQPDLSRILGNFDGRSRHICLWLHDCGAYSDYCFPPPDINILTYLLTYLLIKVIFKRSQNAQKVASASYSATSCTQLL